MHSIAGMFYARASVTPKRVLNHSVPKKKKRLATVYVQQRAQLRARHRPLAHQNAQFLDQNTSPKRPVYAHNHRKALHT